MKLPDLDELLALRAAASGLGLRGRGSARALLLGGHHSAHRGRGMEFEEVRPYVAGDDPRTIDWRVTARRGRTHTKLYREERERPVWLLVDLQPGLYFGTRRQFKSALLVRAAALLAWVAAQDGDRIGAVIAGAGADAEQILPPRLRVAGVLPILGALLDTQPRAPGQPQPERFASALDRLSALAHPGSLILALSDFANLADDGKTSWPRLAARSEIWLFQAIDPIESLALPEGRFRAGLPGRMWTVDGESTRTKWLQLWQERQQRILELTRQLGLPLIPLNTGENVTDVLHPLLRRPQTAA